MRIALLLPELLGTYGDRGNGLVLVRRAQWRGLAADLVPVSANEPVPTGCDVYLLGGGEDLARQEADRLLTSVGFDRVVDGAAVIFAVCAGLQLLGRSRVTPDGDRWSGLGVLDLVTYPGSSRAVGEVVATPDPALGIGTLFGFENHRGHTVLGSGLRPLAQVRKGVGNGDGTDGVLSGNIIATYLHGPVLARNPGLADLVLSRVTGEQLPPMPMDEIDALRRQFRTTRPRVRRPHLRLMRRGERP